MRYSRASACVLLRRASILYAVNTCTLALLVGLRFWFGAPLLVVVVCGSGSTFRLCFSVDNVYVMPYYKHVGNTYAFDNNSYLMALNYNRLSPAARRRVLAFEAASRLEKRAPRYLLVLLGVLCLLPQFGINTLY